MMRFSVAAVLAVLYVIVALGPTRAGTAPVGPAQTNTPTPGPTKDH